MYKCQICGELTKPGQKRLTVKEYRPTDYTNGHGDVVGQGSEISKEQEVCIKCHIQVVTAETAEQEAINVPS